MNGGHYSPHFDYVMKEKNPEHVSQKWITGCSKSMVQSLYHWNNNIHSYFFNAMTPATGWPATWIVMCSPA